jgi:DNA-binding NarL/FixJ family response regulator
LELLLKEADEKILLLNQAGAGGPADGQSRSATAAATALEGVIMEARAPLDAAMPEPQQQLDPRHARVYDLADEGHSPQEIARELERPSGEIELILALRSRSGR